MNFMSQYQVGIITANGNRSFEVAELIFFFGVCFKKVGGRPDEIGNLGGRVFCFDFVFLFFNLPKKEWWFFNFLEGKSGLEPNLFLSLSTHQPVWEKVLREATL